MAGATEMAGCSVSLQSLERPVVTLAEALAEVTPSIAPIATTRTTMR